MKTTRHNAIGKCKACSEIIHSYAGGVFKACHCEKSFIDQERSAGMWVRTGGECELLEQTCPATCELRKEGKHIENKHLTTRNRSNAYLLKTYGIVNGGYEQ